MTKAALKMHTSALNETFIFVTNESVMKNVRNPNRNTCTSLFRNNLILIVACYMICL